MMAQTTGTTTTRAKREEPSSYRTIDEIAELLGLPSWESIDELNLDFYAEVAHGAVRFDEEHASNLDERADAEERYTEAEHAAQDEVYAQWYDAVEHAARVLFEAHGLSLEPAPYPRPKAAREDKRPYRLRIVPRTTWQDAAREIMTTIEGIGMFGYGGSLAEFLASGPYTARRAVLVHLHWIKRYPDVYGTTSAERLYEGAWR